MCGWLIAAHGAGFALTPAHIVSDHPLDRDRAIQASIVRLVDLAHTSRADQRLDRYGQSRVPGVRSMG